jgi:hypothetical protein
MRAIGILALVGVFCVVAVPAASAGTLLTITLNKAAFTPGDTFQATVTNTYKRAVYYRHLDIEQKQSDGSWKLVRGDSECTCGRSCRKANTRLRSGKKKTNTWDYIGGRTCTATGGCKDKVDDCKVVPAGVYRVVIHAWLSYKRPIKMLVHRSAPFTFKP